MTHGCERMMPGLMDGEGACAEEAQGRRGAAGDGRACPVGPGRLAPCEALRLLAALVEGARVPVIAGDVARIAIWVPYGVLDDLPDCVAGLDLTPPAAGPPDASGAWSGTLLPMLREAERLLPEIFDGIGDVVAAPAGGYDIAITVSLAMHDRLALWTAGLDLVEHLIERAASPQPLPLTALEPGVPQELAGLVLGLYAAQARTTSKVPGHFSAA
ncbi:hypothetical protein [Methylobacterium sp. SyP6R]|uniref:hypothetical protein n=1 Tax=Methylobacterium sp. SyP6R TaxID=2718876 RepID=UPI001F26D196|nr:hypothetical protein [Methylobacterium sp. SyP6R]MCF4130267.1 hypothetical protein [Methylobacterium sp. SyP6R]